MMCEAFRRLTEFGALESYRYIGFGSPYFSDFQMVHKQLNVQNMVCIEVNQHDSERFRFNRPFGCVDLRFGHSNAVLPTLSWDMRSIVWLDYDGALDTAVLTDIGLLCSQLQSGSILAVSVNVESDANETARREKMKKAVGEDRFPATIEDRQPDGTTILRPIEESDLAGRNLAFATWRIIRNEIDSELLRRNGGRPHWQKFVFKQIFNFHYADGAKMLTVGGVLYDRGQEGHVARCAFNTLPFVKTERDAYKIEVPLLTYRELRHLDSQLPIENPADLKAAGVPQREITRYASAYRWFPTFAESEL